MRGGGLRLAAWCDAGGDFTLPITSSDHDLLFVSQRYAVFLNMQNSHKTADTLWVFHLWNLPFLYVLVYISVYRSSRRYAPQDDKSVISSDRRESRNLNHANITNIPDPGHKKGLFSGRRSHFPIRGQENGRFSGPPVQPSVPIKEKPPQNAVARLWGLLRPVNCPRKPALSWTGSNNPKWSYHG